MEFNSLSSHLHSPDATRIARLIREASASKWSCRYLILLRGLPGSGKTTLARFLLNDISDGLIVSIDQFLLDPSTTTFVFHRSAQLEEAQAACKQRVWSALHSGVVLVVVDNENLTAAEMEPYVFEAVKCGYSIHFLEPNSPWRYNPRKLIKYTSKRISLDELKNKLATFDRELVVEQMINDAQKRMKSLALMQRLVDCKPDQSRLCAVQSEAAEPAARRGSEEQATVCVPRDPMKDAMSSPATNEPSIVPTIASSTSSTHEASRSSEPTPNMTVVDDDSVKELASVFPHIAAAQIKECLLLTQGDVEWASSILLDDHSFHSNYSHARMNEVPLDSSTMDPVSETLTESNSEALPTEPSPYELKDSCQFQIPEDESPSEQEPRPVVRLTRKFILDAHEIYAYSLGLSSVDLSPEAVPDFLFEEWSPEPSLTRAIYQSFMQHLGVWEATTSTSRTTTSLHSGSRRKHAGRNRAVRSCLPDCVQPEDEAIHRSVEDFRSSLDSPVVRRIITRLMSHYPGIQRSTVDEAFVRCDFNEAETEQYLSRKYSSSERRSNNCPPVIDDCSSETSERFEQLSLKEIQDVERALHHSIEDQNEQLRPLASQLKLHRLKCHFPEVQEVLLKSLLIKFDLDAQKVSNHLVRKGFNVQRSAPLIAQRPNTPSTNTHVPASSVSTEDIRAMRRHITDIKERMHGLKDGRIRAFYSSELQGLYENLNYLLLRNGEATVDSRSKEQEKHFLQEGDDSTVARQKSHAYLDLHGLDKRTALQILRRRLEELESKLENKSAYKVTKLTVITGRGGATENDIVHRAPALRPMLMNFLETKGYRFVEHYREGSGCFTVNLPAIQNNKAVAEK